LGSGVVTDRLNFWDLCSARGAGLKKTNPSGVGVW
jgi:hypothetical protein